MRESGPKATPGLQLWILAIAVAYVKGMLIFLAIAVPLVIGLYLIGRYAA